MSSPSFGLIVVAAGISSRMNGVDKVFSDLCGRPVVWHSLANLGPAASRVVLVIREDQAHRAAIEFSDMHPSLTIVPGGSERQDSVRLGLSVLDRVDIIAVHDAARPLAEIDLLHGGIAALETCDGAIPALSVPDTIKRIEADGRIIETLERSSLRLAQTPQLFWTSALTHGHAAAEEQSQFYTDDACLLENAGYLVRCFPGSARNIKITTRSDLDLARYLLAHDRQI